MLSWWLTVIEEDRRKSEAGTESFDESDSDISVDNLDESSEQRPEEWLPRPKSRQYHLLKTYSLTDVCRISISLLFLLPTTAPPMSDKTSQLFTQTCAL